MTRLLRVVLVALLLGPQAAALILPSSAACEESRNCCAPDGACDADCVACPCCVSPAPGVTPIVSPGIADAPAGAAGAMPATVALPLLPTDILHVPRSL